jgi:hypothetical protein
VVLHSSEAAVGAVPSRRIRRAVPADGLRHEPALVGQVAETPECRSAWTWHVTAPGRSAP